MSLVLCTIHSPEQKTESAKNGKGSMSLPFFQSLRVQQVAPTVSPPGSVGASALKCRGLHRRPAPFAREASRFIYYIRRGLAALSTVCALFCTIFGLKRRMLSSVDKIPRKKYRLLCSFMLYLTQR